MSAYLVDTHLLLWSVLAPERLSQRARRVLVDRELALKFSHATLWEVAIKTALRKPGFDIDPKQLHSVLAGEGFEELPIAVDHIAAVAGLPPLHGDPFDRMLVAQAAVEGLTLLTADAALKRYGRFVRAL
jgi:PIN domain nuclease of toxin-antitoxin system